MKRLILIGTIAAFGVTGMFAQDTAKQDVKKAGEDTKDAAKHVGSATKKGATKSTHAVKKGVHKGATKVADKTKTT